MKVPIDLVGEILSRTRVQASAGIVQDPTLIYGEYLDTVQPGLNRSRPGFLHISTGTQQTKLWITGQNEDHEVALFRYLVEPSRTYRKWVHEIEADFATLDANATASGKWTLSMVSDGVTNSSAMTYSTETQYFAPSSGKVFYADTPPPGMSTANVESQAFSDDSGDYLQALSALEAAQIAESKAASAMIAGNQDDSFGPLLEAIRDFPVEDVPWKVMVSDF